MTYTGPGAIPADHNAAMAAARRRISADWLARFTPETEAEAAAVAHLREWCHDGSACPICAAAVGRTRIAPEPPGVGDAAH